MPGHVPQAETGVDEEGVRAQCSLRLRNRFDHLQFEWQACSVCQY